MTILGATGVEDTLQENVKECVIEFRDAGMSVWMLTGDNGITAKEIGISSGILDSTNLVNGKSKNLVEIAEDVDEEDLLKISSSLATITGDK